MIKWSATRINIANYCRMRYYLAYADPDKPKPLRLAAYVRGSLLHGLIENFWEKLGKQEEVKYDKNGKITSKKKYYDAETFAKYAQGKWKSIAIADEKLIEKYEQVSRYSRDEAEKIKEHLIYWSFEGQKWAIANDLPKLCIPLFEHIIKEGPPIFSELEFDFILNNRRFNGRIDEIRIKNDRIYIRDYKSGKPWLGEMKLSFDPQLTMYNVGLCSLCYSHKEVAEKLGLETKIVDRFMGNPDFVYPEFGVEFFMIDALGIDSSNPKIKNIPDVIASSERKNEHFYEVIKMIEGTEESVRTGNIYPERGRKCDDCDMKIACANKLNCVRTGNLVDKKGQLYFNFATPLFLKKEEQPAPKPRKFRFRYPK
ncbi:MAG: PD-(D/E)XK nuclease family protein [Candidatus Pacearchaeota archaeon]